MNNESRHSNSLPDKIAVIGTAGRFPGADDVAAFWSNLVNGVSGIGDIAPPPSSDLPLQPNYVAKSAALDDAEHFDAKFFGIFPKQAVEMDPQHRVFLETCWQALEDAGYASGQLAASVGVFAGCHMNTYILTRMAADPAYRQSLADSFPGGSLIAEIASDKDYLATRVAYELNLRGPAIAVQSACSTSLVAIAMACESLLAGSCEMAIAGGATITFPQRQGYLHTDDSILSPDGLCRTFDANASGTIFGDGVGAVILKRLSDAIDDRDDIYAVIRGWGVSNDGSDKSSYTAPSVSGQSTAIRLAHQRAGITADTIGYVEAHGTGTLVGDPIEIQALTEAFRETTDKTQFCRIASLKSNVGHLDVAAGVAGVIKTSLALKHQLLPPVLNFQTPNPQIDFGNSPFIVNTSLTRWESNGRPRRAGVSSFGVGGTNAHLVMEEAPPVDEVKTRRSCQILPWHIIRLSARSTKALDQMSEDLARHLETNEDLDLGDVAYTLQVGRKQFEHKRFVVARDAKQAAQSLRGVNTNGPGSVRHPAGGTDVAFLLPGQGSQHVNMADQLYRSEPLFAEQLDACVESLIPHLGMDLRGLIFAADGKGDARQLDKTEFAQPALFAVSYSLGRWWQSLGIEPDVFIGHSVGEFAAAALAGVMSMEDAARLVAVRGQLMQALPAGSMLAVYLAEHELLPLLNPQLEIAAINGPTFCVVSGPTDRVAELAQSLEAGDLREPVACRMLKTSHAFHSAMMDKAIAPFARELSRVRLRPPKIPIVSTVTGEPMDESTAVDPQYWARQIREPVRFAAAVEHVLKTGSGPRVLLEVGPNQALSTLVRNQTLDAAKHHVVSSLPHVKLDNCCAEWAMQAVGQLWQLGVGSLGPSPSDRDSRRRVHLPTYRFQRQRYSFAEQVPSPSPRDTNATGQAAPCPLPESTNAGARAASAKTFPTTTGSTCESPGADSARPAVGNRQVAQVVIAQQMELMNRQISLLRNGKQSLHSETPDQ